MVLLTGPNQHRASQTTYQAKDGNRTPRPSLFTAHNKNLNLTSTPP